MSMMARMQFMVFMGFLGWLEPAGFAEEIEEYTSSRPSAGANG